MNDVELLKGVRKVLEVHGWTRGVAVDALGQRCLGRAIVEVGPSDVQHRVLELVAAEIPGDIVPICKGDYLSHKVVAFNDAPGRTKEEIFDFLDNLIAKLQAKYEAELAIEKAKLPAVEALVKGEESVLV